MARAAAQKIIRPSDNRRHITHPLPLLPFGTTVDAATTISAATRETITNYKPRGVTPAAWDAAASFVVDVVVAMNPKNQNTARRLMTMVSLFACWVWTVSGCTLTVANVFTDANVRRFVQVHNAAKSESYRFDLTRQLCTIGERLLGIRMHRAPAPRASQTAPYSASELADLVSWAASASTDLRRRNGFALLAACAGAGLTAQEFVRASVDDIDDIDGVFYITVTQPDTGVTRRVPVRREWHNTMDRALLGHGGALLFQGHRGADTEARGLQGFISAVTGSEQVRPSAHRLRATWLTAQLDAGTPLGLVLELAGLSDPGSLTSYLAHAKPVSIEHHLETILGSAVIR